MACAFGYGGVANAAPGSERGVELEVAPSCDRVDRAQLGRLLNVEERRDSDSGVQKLKVSVSCQAQTATLRVERRDATSEPRVRELRLNDVAGEVGARVLSLAAIELLNDLETAPAAPEPEPEPAPKPTPPPPPAPPPREAPPSVRLMAAGAIHSFQLERPLAGGGIAVDYLRLGRLGLRLEFDVAVGAREYDLGSADLRLTTLSAQFGYLAIHDSWTARAFAGYRFGNGRIAGEKAPGSLALEGTVAGVCGGPLLSGGLGLRSGSFVAELGGELGLVSFPLEGRVADQAPVRLGGYWLGVSLNVGALL
jgi:hypothetical protein